MTRRYRSRGFRLIELLVVIAITSLSIALLLPVVQAGARPPAAPRCTDNLKQIGLAMHNYENANGCFPPGEKGCCWGTWGGFILSYIEQSALYNAWNSFGNNVPSGGVANRYFRFVGPANTMVTYSAISTFGCPSDPNAFVQRQWGCEVPKLRSQLRQCRPGSERTVPRAQPSESQRLLHVCRCADSPTSARPPSTIRATRSTSPRYR